MNHISKWNRLYLSDSGMYWWKIIIWCNMGTYYKLVVNVLYGTCCTGQKKVCEKFRNWHPSKFLIVYCFRYVINDTMGYSVTQTKSSVLLPLLEYLILKSGCSKHQKTHKNQFFVKKMKIVQEDENFLSLKVELHHYLAPVKIWL